MANRAQSQYLRIFDNASTYLRWQNFYVNQTVTLSSASWTYFPFTADGLTAGAPGSEADLSLQMPATESAIAAFTAALNNNRLLELKVYEFDSRLSQSAPQAGQVLIASVLAEVVSMSGTLTTLTIKLGSGLAPVGAQVPPRKFTNKLIGAPIRI
jgi:hypothetical protein